MVTVNEVKGFTKEEENLEKLFQEKTGIKMSFANVKSREELREMLEFNSQGNPRKVKYFFHDFQIFIIGEVDSYLKSVEKLSSFNYDYDDALVDELKMNEEYLLEITRSHIIKAKLDMVIGVGNWVFGFKTEFGDYVFVRENNMKLENIRILHNLTTPGIHRGFAQDTAARIRPNLD